MKTELLTASLKVNILEASDIRRLLPARDRYAHKGDFGKVMLVCGAVGYTGAPALASRAALRCGSGLVFTLVPDAVYPIVAGKLDEAMVFPLPCEDGKIAYAAKAQIAERMVSCTCALLGPGLGRSEDLDRLLPELVSESKIPLVVDADGLNAFAGHIDILREAACPLILTPHDGEFARLLPEQAPLPREDLSARCEKASELAKRTGAVVLLKGHRTVITDGKTFYVNRTGNPGMATGGSGDVLAGMIVSLLGQGVAPLEAAALGAYLHGAAGDLCARELGECGLLPSDMIMAAARLLK